MRRIVTGAIAAVLFLTPMSSFRISDILVAKEPINYTKTWETKLEDNVLCVPVVSEDGSIYGINANVTIGQKGKLVKVKDGNLLWSSQEEVVALQQNVWPIIIVNDNVVFAGISKEIEKLDTEFEFVFYGYKADGRKSWEKNYTFSGVIPSYRCHEDKIWLVYDNYVRIIDPATGEETNKLDLGPTNPKPLSSNSILEGGGGGLGYDNFKLYFLTFSENILVLQQLDGIRAYEITSELSLKLKWFKKTETNELSITDLSLILQSNSEIFLLSNPGGGFKCFDTKTGEEIWTINSEDSFFTFYFYNKTHVIKISLSGVSCYEVKPKKLLWERDKLIIPAAFDENIIVTNAAIDEDFEVNKQVSILDVSTGDVIVKLKEENVNSAVISGDDLFLVKENQLLKYTKCNPCLCELEVFWKDTKTDKLSSDICSMESKEFDIILENTSKDAVIDCNLSTSSTSLNLSKNSAKMEPGKQIIVKATYSSSLNEPEVTECKVSVSSSCGKSFELMLDIKKTSSCKDKLKKFFEYEVYTSHIFGNTMVSMQMKEDDSEFAALVGIDLLTGRTLWTIDREKLEGVGSFIHIVYREKDSFICVSGNDELSWFKIDIKGKIIWQRKGGIFMNPHTPILTFNNDWNEDESTFDLFDVKTGQNVISGLTDNLRFGLTPIAQFKDKFLFSIGSSDVGYMLCDSKGNRIWEKQLQLCLNKSVFSTDFIYLVEKLPPKENDFDESFKMSVSKASPDNLKKAWSVEIEGTPEIINETKDKLWLKTRFGIYCISSSNGKIIWSIADGKYEFGKAILANGKICVGASPYLSEESVSLANSMLVLEPDTGKKVVGIDIGDSIEIILEDQFVYSYGTFESDEGQKCNIHCIDNTNWKEKWSISVEGYPVIVGNKTFILNNNELTWLEEGKIVGKTKLTSVPALEDEDEDQLKIDWDKSKVFVSTPGELLAYDSKTSTLAWRIKSETSQTLYRRDGHTIVTGNKNNKDGDQSMFDYVQTPCWVEGNIFISSQGKLTVYRSVEE